MGSVRMPRLVVCAIYATLFSAVACEDVVEMTMDDLELPGTHHAEFGEAKSPRYLLWEVNPGEGFNLRRDVYLRMANLMNNLNKDEPWILVLPPWGPLYHWAHREIEQSRIPWALFFDIPSLRLYTHVIEFSEFVKVIDKPWVIDEVYYLQHYKGGWGGEWKEKMEKSDDCHNMIDYRKYTFDKKLDLWKGWFFNYNDEVHAKLFQCLSIQSDASFLKPFLLQNTTGLSIMVDRAETVMHDRFADVHYWKGFWQKQETWTILENKLKLKATLLRVFPRFILNQFFCWMVIVNTTEDTAPHHVKSIHVVITLGTADKRARRSMVFAKPLRDIGDIFRAKYLDSVDETDRTVKKEDWTKVQKKPGDAKGGPYIGVHLRRADFAISRKKDVPTLEGAAEKIVELLKKYKLKKVFIATDVREEWEFEEVKKGLAGYEVLRFVPNSEILNTYMDGGIAIIDQWICAHARYFIGTRESTFSFRIQEERQIMGFDLDMTFNSFCGQGWAPGEEREEWEKDAKVEDLCNQPSRWEIVY